MLRRSPIVESVLDLAGAGFGFIAFAPLML
jgi:hypothetical protein